MISLTTIEPGMNTHHARRINVLGREPVIISISPAKRPAPEAEKETQ